MENRLKRELDALPTPNTTFEELEAMQRSPESLWRPKRTMVLIAAVLALLLCGMGWAKTQFGMWHLVGSKEYSDLEKAAAKYQVVLPEKLNGVPFWEYNEYGLVPQGAPLSMALTNPSYKPRTVTYGWRVSNVETYPDGLPQSETAWTETELSLHFGTTENELWRYYFQMDENGVWTAWDVPGSYCTMEYRDITLQIGDTSFYDDVLGDTRYIRWIHWVDEDKQVAFSISETDYTNPNRVVECAMAIIDLNS